MMTRDSYAYLIKMADLRQFEAGLYRMKADTDAAVGDNDETYRRLAASYDRTAADYRRWAAAAPDAPKVTP